MGEKRWENQYRTTVIYVDSFARGIPAGRLWNPAAGEIPFYGVMEFLREMEALLDGMQCPQPFLARRSFLPPEGQILRGEPPGGEGGIAAFSVRVMFRRNASWQGSVTWLGQDKTEDFRSTMELLLLMDSALREKTGS